MIQARISELLAEYQIPSVAVGILHNGEITEFAIGVKDVETREAATTDTIYQCGSLSKTWTALAFMQLVDEGKVSLDEPVRAYLPDFRVADPDVSAKVTPRHLLNHTNGIEEEFGDPGEGEDVYERMVANIADAPQVQPLGYTHGYSAALGYAILARIMEVIDGKRWDAIMKARLFDPLGLTSTTTRHDQVDQGRAATGHIIRSLDEGPIHTPVAYLPRSFGPGGNVNSTVREVLALAHIFLGNGPSSHGTGLFLGQGESSTGAGLFPGQGRSPRGSGIFSGQGRSPSGSGIGSGQPARGAGIVSSEVIHEMMHSRVAIPDPYMFGPEWALGLIVCDWHGETVYAHDGSSVGQNARLRILPDSDLAITMMMNGGPRESFYRRAFNEILTGLGAVTVPELPEPDPTLDLDLSRYEGVYQRSGTRYEVRAEDGRLFLAHDLNPMEAQFLGKPDRLRYELLPVSETHFLMPSDDPLEDTQTVAIYDFKDGVAQYLHTNCRVSPRADP